MMRLHKYVSGVVDENNQVESKATGDGSFS